MTNASVLDGLRRELVRSGGGVDCGIGPVLPWRALLCAVRCCFARPRGVDLARA